MARASEIITQSYLNGAANLGQLPVPFENRFAEVNAQLADIAINVKNFGVTGFGDETTKLAEALNYIANNHKFLLIPKEMSITTNNITITGKNNFGIICMGIIKRPDSAPDGATIVLLGCSEVYIPQINFDGNALNNGAVETGNSSNVKEFQHSFQLIDCNNIIMHDFFCKNPSGDALYIRNSNNLKIGTLESKSDLCVGRNTLTLISGNGLYVDNLICNGTGHISMPGGLDIEPNLSTDSVSNVNIKNVYIRSAGTNPFALMATNGSTVSGITIGSAHIEKIKLDTVKRESCLISASNVHIEYIFIDGGGYDNFITLNNMGVKPTNITITESYAKNVATGILVGFSGNVEDVNIKATIKNCTGDGIQLYSVKNIRFNVDIQSVGASRFVVNKSGDVVAENVYITGNISKRGTGVFALTSSAAAGNIVNWVIENLDFSGWGENTRVRGVAYQGNLRKHNCFNLTTGTKAPVYDDWTVGDKVENSTLTELGTSPNKYVIDHWRCIATGYPGTWLQCRSLTGN